MNTLVRMHAPLSTHNHSSLSSAYHRSAAVLSAIAVLFFITALPVMAQGGSSSFAEGRDNSNGPYTGVEAFLYCYPGRCNDTVMPSRSQLILYTGIESPQHFENPPDMALAVGVYKVPYTTTWYSYSYHQFPGQPPVGYPLAESNPAVAVFYTLYYNDAIQGPCQLPGGGTIPAPCYGMMMDDSIVDTNIFPNPTGVTFRRVHTGERAWPAVGSWILDSYAMYNRYRVQSSWWEYDGRPEGASFINWRPYPPHSWLMYTPPGGITSIESPFSLTEGRPQS
jgi:hypothetical protein